jgi:hypothetical protein
MNEADMRLIEAYACGDASLRHFAILVHRRCIPTVGVRGNIHQCFMAEVDNPSPDLEMRSHYRRELAKFTAASR